MYGLNNICKAITPGLRKFCTPSKLESDYAIFYYNSKGIEIFHT